MRKNYLSVIVLTLVFCVVGCDQGKMIPIKVNQDMSLLKIERCLFTNLNPCLVILAKKIIIDYEKRTIVIEGLMNIAGGYVDWVVPEMNIRGDSLVISLPNDSDYNVQKGENRFYLPLIKK